MTGPEHYREAERLLDGLSRGIERAQQIGSSGASMAAALDNVVAQAQVHATLALAAATALPADYVGWKGAVQS